MRFRLFALPASFILAGTALAQNPPNAIGIWNSQAIPNATVILFGPDGGGGGGATGLALPLDGALGNRVWKVLSSEVMNYFRTVGSGGARTMDFRGLDFYMFVNVLSTGTPSEVPAIDVQLGQASTNPALAGHDRPNFATPTVYTTFPATPWGANPLGTAVFFRKTIVGAPAVVPSGAAAGSSIGATFKDYYRTGTITNEKTHLMMTFNEDGADTTHPIDYSGYTSPAGGSLFFAIGTNVEWIVSFLFDQSMIQPIKRSKQASSGDFMPSSSPPANYPAFFSIICDDGKGGMRQTTGDVPSYMANSLSNGIPDPTGGSTRYVVPFTLFSGDVIGGPPNDPAPENWVDDGGVAQLAYVHPMSEQAYVDGLCAIFFQPPIGAAIDPANHTLGLWLGVDLGAGLVNVVAAVNGIAFADVSSGPAWAGPEILRYDSLDALGMTSPLGINLDDFGAGHIAEVKNPVVPVSGYTPLGGPPVQQVNGHFGFGIIPFPLVGQSFSVNCWVYETNDPTGYAGFFTITDLTNSIRIQL